MAPDITDVADKKTFGQALASLVRTAHANGVTVEGGWEVNGEHGLPDWDVVVTVVERED
ncbi:MAG: hypothetical protein V5A30_03715 [Haloarculaceae archaeon]